MVDECRAEQCRKIVIVGRCRHSEPNRTGIDPADVHMAQISEHACTQIGVEGGDARDSWSLRTLECRCRRIEHRGSVIGWIETLFGCASEECESVARVARRVAGPINPQRTVFAGLVERRQFAPRCRREWKSGRSGTVVHCGSDGIRHVGARQLTGERRRVRCLRR